MPLPPRSFAILLTLLLEVTCYYAFYNSAAWQNVWLSYLTLYARSAIFSLNLLFQRRLAWVDRSETKLQALVYDILPSTTAVFSYAKGSRKLSSFFLANEFFLGAQTVVSLLETTQKL